MTQLERARNNEITLEMEKAASKDGIDPEDLRRSIANGNTVIPANKLHRHLEPIAIGKVASTKINANFGTSPYDADVEKELRKQEASIRHGADTVMDLSTGGDLDSIRSTLIAACTVPFGTVPIYQAMADAESIDDVDGDAMIQAVRRHAEQGVDFVTVHAGVTQDVIPLLKGRLGGVVSRGGSFLVSWMMKNEANNPLYERFDEVIDIAYEYDVTLSLGDGLRPGCLSDASDKAQYHELKVLGDLTKKAWARDVQVMIEGPGHVPLHLIKENIEMQKEHCHGAPFYVLGPLVTDIGAGYDHITSAIGGALAASYGADFLCYVTPSEHLKLPNIEEVIDGVIASKIAAHAADIAKGFPGAMEWDDRISRARRNLDWDEQIRLTVNPNRAKMLREQSEIDTDECTMCGQYCALKAFTED